MIAILCEKTLEKSAIDNKINENEEEELKIEKKTKGPIITILTNVKKI